MTHSYRLSEPHKPGRKSVPGNLHFRRVFARPAIDESFAPSGTAEVRGPSLAACGWKGKPKTVNTVRSPRARILWALPLPLLGSLSPTSPKQRPFEFSPPTVAALWVTISSRKDWLRGFVLSSGVSCGLSSRGTQ